MEVICQSLIINPNIVKNPHRISLTKYVKYHDSMIGSYRIFGLLICSTILPNEIKIYMNNTVVTIDKTQIENSYEKINDEFIHIPLSEILTDNHELLLTIDGINNIDTYLVDLQEYMNNFGHFVCI